MLLLFHKTPLTYRTNQKSMIVFDTETILLMVSAPGGLGSFTSGSFAASLAIGPATNLFGMADDWLHCAVITQNHS